ncbi:MAG TPA: hypothetical protein VL307_06525, partial [Chitinophagaceae bacterium]|nr:hypothetical protein [Chitinophagaceae bacterium]
MEYFHYPHSFALENGQLLPEITVAFQTYGEMNADKSNIVWVCHHLTASAAVAEWWPGVIGEGLVLDPSRYFIICANILGS